MPPQAMEGRWRRSPQGQQAPHFPCTPVNTHQTSRGAYSRIEPSPGHAAVASDAGYMITCAATGGSRNIRLPYPEGLTWSAACAGSPSAASPPAITHPYMKGIVYGWHIRHHPPLPPSFCLLLTCWILSRTPTGSVWYAGCSWGGRRALECSGGRRGGGGARNLPSDRSRVGRTNGAVESELSPKEA